MAKDIESRVTELEKQVADLSAYINRMQLQDRRKAINSASENCGDALLIQKENEYADPGAYCLPCWKAKEALSPLPITFDKIPSALSRSALQIQCPECKKYLSLQWANR